MLSSNHHTFAITAYEYGHCLKAYLQAWFRNNLFAHSYAQNNKTALNTEKPSATLDQ